MSHDTVDDLHAVEDQVAALAYAVRELLADPIVRVLLNDPAFGHADIAPTLLRTLDPLYGCRGCEHEDGEWTCGEDCGCSADHRTVAAGHAYEEDENQ
jgi:hypothetical protein